MTSKSQVVFHAAMTLWYMVYAVLLMIICIWLLGYRWDILGNQCGFGIQYISIWVVFMQTFYFAMRLKEDLTIDKEEKEKLSKPLSEIFTYVILPVTVVVSTVFWSIYSIDKRLVDRFDFLIDVGSIANHITHTTTSIFVLLEAFLCSKPRSKISLCDVFWINFAFFLFYDLILEGLYSMSGLYPYEFLTYLNDSLKPTVCAGVAVLGVATVAVTYTAKEYVPNYLQVHLKSRYVCKHG